MGSTSNGWTLDVSVAVSGVVRGVEVGVDSTDRPPGPMEMVVEVGGELENCTVSSLTYGYAQMYDHVAGPHTHAQMDLDSELKARLQL